MYYSTSFLLQQEDHSGVMVKNAPRIRWIWAFLLCLLWGNTSRLCAQFPENWNQLPAPRKKPFWIACSISLNRPPDDHDRIKAWTELLPQLTHADIQQAKEVAEKALALSQKLNDKVGSSTILYQLGGIHYMMQEREKSLEYYLRSLSLAEESGDPGAIAQPLGGLTTHHSMLRNYDKLKEYNDRLFSVSNKLQGKNKQQALTKYWYYEGELARLAQKDFDQAEKAYLQALKVCDTLDVSSGRPEIYQNLGHTSREKKAYQKAITYYEKAVEAAPVAAKFKYTTNANVYIAMALQALGRHQEALKKLSMSLDVARKYKIAPLIANTHQLMAASKRALGDYQGAAADYDVAIHLRDSLLSSQMQQRMAEMDARYQNERNEAIIARKDLQLSQEKHRRSRLTWGALALIALLLAATAFYLMRRRAKERETRLALQLKEAEAQSLKELDRLKSHFFANISHEFRTPLTLILGPIKRLLGTQQLADPTTYYQIIQRNGERLLQLVNQLLDLSRLEAGRMVLDLQPGDLHAFLRGVVHSFLSLAELKDIHFSTSISQELFYAAFDRDKLQKVLSNLLSNAFKFTPEGGKVYVKAEVEEGASTPMLHLRVQDSGIGIPEQDMERVFDRFFHAKNEAQPGSGIGLALTKELVELHGGQISVESVEGFGTTFEVLLPLTRTEQLPSPEGKEEAEEQAPVASISPPSLTKASEDAPLILIVEDHEDVRRLLSDSLASDYHLIEAPDGQKGLELATEQVPDIIISDIMMPVMDGFELTKRLKQSDATSHIPLILLTARSDRKARLEGLEGGG